MVKKYRPTTSTRRFTILPSFGELTRKAGARATIAPTKRLVKKKAKINGRNNLGRITCRHRGGGHKRKLRVVDFLRDKEEIPATVASIEYDPNRSAFIALLNYADGEKRYILSPEKLKVGDVVKTSKEPPFSVGTCMRLKHMPVGSVIHNIEMIPGKGAKLVRSAGMSAQLSGCANGIATIRLPSSEMRTVSEDCKATFGSVSNSEHVLRKEGKAGRSRWKGIRPTTRGMAMNPVDHPLGGGNGKSKGNIPQSPWGLEAKGKKTRSKKKTNKYIIQARKRKKAKK
jgi:large subunit ribosomal protein L2